MKLWLPTVSLTTGGTKTSVSVESAKCFNGMFVHKNVQKVSLRSKLENPSLVFSIVNAKNGV